MAVQVAWIATFLASGVVLAQQPAGDARGAHDAHGTRGTHGAPGTIGRIGVEVFGPAGLPADLRTRLEDAAAAGLKASGADVLSRTDAADARARAALGPCTEWGCEQRLAQMTSIRYWLRGTCQVDASTYRLHVELVDARSGTVQAARDDTCDICTEADAAETANAAASALKASLGRAPLPTAPQAARPVEGDAVSPAARVASTGDAVPNVVSTPLRDGAAQNHEAPLWRRLLPWTAFAAAAAAGTAGGYYLAINNRAFGCKGQSPDRNCQFSYDTLWQWGIPLVAVGAALATTGIVLLATGGTATTPEKRLSQVTGTGARPSTQIVIFFNSLALTGTF